MMGEVWGNQGKRLGRRGRGRKVGASLRDPGEGPADG